MCSISSLGPFVIEKETQIITLFPAWQKLTHQQEPQIGLPYRSNIITKEDSKGVLSKEHGSVFTKELFSNNIALAQSNLPINYLLFASNLSFFHLFFLIGLFVLLPQAQAEEDQSDDSSPNYLSHYFQQYPISNQANNQYTPMNPAFDESSPDYDDLDHLPADFVPPPESEMYGDVLQRPSRIDAKVSLEKLNEWLQSGQIRPNSQDPQGWVAIKSHSFDLLKSCYFLKISHDSHPSFSSIDNLY